MTFPPLHHFAELNHTVKVTLAPSKVHGIGVIALCGIQKGEKCYVSITEPPVWYKASFKDLKKKLNPKIFDLLIGRWPQIINGSMFVSPNHDARLTSFLNHSDTPNYDQATDLALIDIKAGDELFEDYRVIDNYKLAYPWLKK